MGHEQVGARRSVGARRTDDESEELVAYCCRPKCRNELRHHVGPGRRKAYCSVICRRTAEKELRQARSRLSHFESLVEQLRVDVAAFGKSDDDADSGQSPVDVHREAEDAVNRAEGALMFLGDSDEPAAKALRALYSAVEPVIRHRDGVTT